MKRESQAAALHPVYNLHRPQRRYVSRTVANSHSGIRVSRATPSIPFSGRPKLELRRAELWRNIGLSRIYEQTSMCVCISKCKRCKSLITIGRLIRRWTTKLMRKPCLQSLPKALSTKCWKKIMHAHTFINWRGLKCWLFFRVKSTCQSR